MNYNGIVNVLDVWKETEDETSRYCAIAEIGKNAVVGKIYIEFDTKEVEGLILQCEKTTDKFAKEQLQNSIACHILRDFDKYISLPKLAETSELLQCCFNNLIESDNTMFFIENAEELNDYDFTIKDLKILKAEIEKYSLQDVVVLYDYDLITAYGDLRKKFIF